MKELMTIEDWEGALQASETRPVLVLKHSTRCPISSGAYDRFTRYLEAAGSECPDSYLVKVIEARPVSSAIAAALGVEHKSPQLILIHNRRALWSSSHHGITGENVADAVRRFAAPPAS